MLCNWCLHFSSFLVVSFHLYIIYFLQKNCQLFFYSLILSTLLGILLPRSKSSDSYPSSFIELPESSPWFGDEEIRIFREYLTIPTVYPDIDYGDGYNIHVVIRLNFFVFIAEPCVEFLKKQALSLDLPVSVYYPVDEKNPVVVISWIGSDQSLSSIMLNSHMDVVPVFEESWTHPPFAAEVDDRGRIFARGAQDTKVLGTMYLAAIRALKKEGIKQLKRTFHVTFVPDEEMGGFLGMAGFVLTDEFKAMNVGYALDEGVVSLDRQITVHNDERSPWRIEFTCHGITGHGSILFENTTGEKITYLINKFMEMRQDELDRMNNLNLPYGNVTSINLTILKGGVQGNVIPPELSVVFDVRLAVNVNHDDFERKVRLL